MPCAKCGKWITGQWTAWHACDQEPPPARLNDLYSWCDGRAWYFYCADCKRDNAGRISRGMYVNADGGASTDSASEDSERDHLAHAPTLPLPMDCWDVWSVSRSSYYHTRLARDGQGYDLDAFCSHSGANGKELFEGAMDWTNLADFCCEMGVEKVMWGDGDDVKKVLWGHMKTSSRYVGLLFAGHLVCFPLEYAARCEYMKPVSPLNRTQVFRIGDPNEPSSHMVIYDLLQDADYFSKMKEWRNVDFGRVARELAHVLASSWHWYDGKADDIELYRFLGAL